MCELMTIAATLVFAAWHFSLKRRGRTDGAVFATMLMFLGAALMWGVDCVAGAMEGDALFDISKDDTLLGCVVFAAGLAVFGLVKAFGRASARKAAV